MFKAAITSLRIWTLTLTLLCIQFLLPSVAPAVEQALPQQAGVQACAWPQAPVIIAQAEHELHQLWQFEDQAGLWLVNLPDSQSLLQFRQQVQSRLPVLGPRAYFATHPPEQDDEIYNKLLGASGRAGVLRPINCLEALLLSVQSDRLPMLTQPSEFGAFILRKKIKSKYQYKIYFSTQDQPGLRMNAEVMQRIAADRHKGWRVWTHLHNHNFFFDKSDPFAPPSPSQTDVMFARMMHQSLDLEQLWITNGFHTLHINQREFYLFRDHNDLK